jgi:membrane protein YdbS with pleckstrin-like domain
MSNRFRIASLVYMMTNAVLFGIGMVSIMTIPALARNAMDWVPMAVIASFILAAPIAWWIAPRLRARYWRHRGGDVISGPSTATDNP